MIKAKIISEADNLDALGTIGIARCFTYGGERGLSIHDPSLPPEVDPSTAGATQFNHLHKKSSISRIECTLAAGKSPLRNALRAYGSSPSDSKKR